MRNIYQAASQLILGVWASSFVFAVQAANCPVSVFEGFEDNANGTVTDPRNGLIWKKCAEGYTWNGSKCVGQPLEVSWFDAMKLAKRDRYLGKNDWRLPTMMEFGNVIAAEKYEYDGSCQLDWPGGGYFASKKIAHKYHENGHPGWFWSTSSYDDRYTKGGDFSNRWYFDGHTGPREQNAPFRLVRSSKSGDNSDTEFKREFLSIPTTMAKTSGAIGIENASRSEYSAKVKAACARLYVGKSIAGWGVIVGVGNGRATMRSSVSGELFEKPCTDWN